MTIIKSLAWTAPAVTATAALGTVATRAGVESDWYARLEKPPFQPAPIVFPIAWTALYASLAGAAAAADSKLDDTARHVERIGAGRAAREVRGRRRRFRLAVAVNLALNGGWCFTFFKFGRLPEAAAVAGALAVSTADLARRATAERPSAGAALVPYAAWTAFATLLSASIWQRNRGARSPQAGRGRRS